MQYIKEKQVEGISPQVLEIVIRRINKLIETYNNLERVEAGASYHKEAEEFEPYLSIILEKELENIQIGFDEYEDVVTIEIPEGERQGISFDIPKAESGTTFLSTINYKIIRSKLEDNLGFFITVHIPSKDIQFYLNFYLRKIIIYEKI